MEDVMRRAGVERRLLKTIRKNQLNFDGHILRTDELEKECLLGKWKVQYLEDKESNIWMHRRLSLEKDGGLSIWSSWLRKEQRGDPWLPTLLDRHSRKDKD